MPTLEQIRHVIQTMPASTEIERRDRALIAFTALTGARDGAIASLKLKHVDIDQGNIDQDARQVKTKFSKSFTTWFFPVGDDVRGIAVHLANHDVMLWAVSRAPLAKIQAYKRRMGWSFPWASSFKGEFNFDLNASYTEEQQRKGIEYNYRREAAWEWRSDEGIKTQMDGNPVAFNAAVTGTDVVTYTRERPGVSAFALDNGIVYHTYSTYARGFDSLWGMYQWLDRAPRGRNETGVWWRRHDEYGKD